jgi:hypothetical protein
MDKPKQVPKQAKDTRSHLLKILESKEEFELDDVMTLSAKALP